MMEGRRVRRFGRAQNQTILPFRVRHLSNTVSCWYCDFKSSVLNEPIFRFGRRNSRFLRAWFSVGVGFSITALFGATLILLWELARNLRLLNENNHLSTLLSGSLFGYFPWVFSLADVGYMCMSTVISVSIHELGHALAAASEGIQIEYTAVFLAVLFPGALVAFNYELLQALAKIASLRIYCAGIWHNAALCAVCVLTIVLLPLILYPIYIHGEGPMVLDVSSTSPLSGYLSPGDLIVSLDGMHIHNKDEWMEMTALLHEQTLKDSKQLGEFKGFNTVNGRKGYCVPSSMIEDSNYIQLIDNHTTCPNELTSFATISCSGSSMLNNSNSEDNHYEQREHIHCLNAKDVVKLKRCGDGWMKTLSSNISSCPCSEEESCLAPLQMPGLTWVEIKYSSSYIPKCQLLGERPFLGGNSSDLGEMSCGGTFVFIGDVISMAQSVWLTSYQPRWSFPFGGYLPLVVEKLFICTFHVSLMLMLLNSLPVYFLDGESILEDTLCFFLFLSQRRRELVLQSCLLGGTCISIFLIARIFFLAIFVS